MADEGDFASARSLFARTFHHFATEPAGLGLLMHCAVGEDDPKGAADAQLQIEKLGTCQPRLHTQAAAGWPARHFANRQIKEFELGDVSRDVQASAGVCGFHAWGSAMSWRRTQAWLRGPSKPL